MGNFVFLGPPGAGKGTMAEIVEERCGYTHISTGDLLRDEVKRGTTLGKEIQACIDGGHLVSDELVTGMVAAQLNDPKIAANGVILDGYPRTVTQAELLETALAQSDLSLSAAVLLEVGREALLKRLTARRVCPACKAVYNLLYGPPQQEGTCDKCQSKLTQRADDTLETAKERLRVYEEQTMPLINFYQDRNLLIRVPADKSKDENFQVLCEALKESL